MDGQTDTEETGWMNLRTNMQRYRRRHEAIALLELEASLDLITPLPHPT